MTLGVYAPVASVRSPSAMESRQDQGSLVEKTPEIRVG